MPAFMRLLTREFVEHWHNRQLNIHPSLLPAFKGLHTHERALEADAKITGCTVHFVRFDMDTGPIIAQAAVPILPGDKAADVKARVQTAEHKLYPAALRLAASGRLRIVNERALIEGSPAEAPPSSLSRQKARALGPAGTMPHPSLRHINNPLISL